MATDTTAAREPLPLSQPFAGDPSAGVPTAMLANNITRPPPAAIDSAAL